MVPVVMRANVQGDGTPLQLIPLSILLVLAVVPVACYPCSGPTYENVSTECTTTNELVLTVPASLTLTCPPEVRWGMYWAIRA
jgi:hypothetical protein